MDEPSSPIVADQLPPLIAYLDGPAGLRLTLPNGRTVVGKVLPLSRAQYYLRLQSQRTSATPEQELEIREKIITEFPGDVGLAEELNQLTLGEFWLAFWAFFAQRVPPAAMNGMTTSPIGAGS